MRLLRTLAIAWCMSMVTLSAATDPTIGTWKMNVARSKFSGTAPKSVTSVFSADGDWIVIKTQSVESDGKTVDRTNRYKRDGKAYPFENVNGKGEITVRKIDDHTAEAVTTFGGHSVKSRSVISKDGKTRTMTSIGRNAKGEKVNSVQVYERQ